MPFFVHCKRNGNVFMSPAAVYVDVSTVHVQIFFHNKGVTSMETEEAVASSLFADVMIGASVSEPHLGSSTRPLSVCLSIYIYIMRPSFLVPRTPRYAQT